MNLLHDLEFRGILKQVTDPTLGDHLETGSISVYCGFDPTSDSLHVGSLLPLLTLKRFQLAGHTPIAVSGGATGMIGDPSGKTAERSLQDNAQIERNLAGVRATLARFLDLQGPHAAKLVNNADWFQGVTFIDFLRDVGKHFTVNHMMAKESVRARLEDREHGISYTEFSYMLLQAYDFFVLNEKQNCTLQIGGSDQWGNITAGIDLIRKIRASRGEDTVKVFGLTHPLVSKSDGTKFGKTETGTIWLDPKKTSPYQFYQFFIQTADADVGTYLRYFTFLSQSEITKLDESVKTEPEKRLAQSTLAREITKLVHGEEALKQTELASQALFGTAIQSLDEQTLLDVLSGAPTLKKDRASITAGLSLVDLLVETTLCASKGAARKDLAAGGIYVNNERASDAVATIAVANLIAGGYLVLRKGKKNYYLVAFQ